jgi:hypothetical protein
MEGILEDAALVAGSEKQAKERRAATKKAPKAPAP